MPKRYYFHGDIVSEDEASPMAAKARATWPGQRIFFCSSCDWFANEEHVRKCGNGSRLELDIVRWRKAPAPWRSQWVRPDDTPNFFLKVESEGIKSIDDRMVCARCLGKAKHGWVYGAGSVSLITCGKAACRPRDPKWIAAVDFTTSKVSLGGRRAAERRST